MEVIALQCPNCGAGVDSSQKNVIHAGSRLCCLLSEVL